MTTLSGLFGCGIMVGRKIRFQSLSPERVRVGSLPSLSASTDTVSDFEARFTPGAP
jgi:hypothetical protein